MEEVIFFKGKKYRFNIENYLDNIEVILQH